MPGTSQSQVAVNWEAVINKWIKANFIDPWNTTPTSYTEVTLWNLLAETCRHIVDANPSMIPGTLPAGYIAPQALEPNDLLHSIVMYDKAMFDDFVERLTAHKDAAKTYKEKVTAFDKVVYGSLVTGFAPPLGYSTQSYTATKDQSAHAVGNMIKLLGQLPKWWNQRTEILNSKGNAQLSKLAKDNTVAELFGDSTYVIKSGTATVPTVTDKTIIFRPEKISDIDPKKPDSNGEHRYNPPPHKSTRTSSPIAYEVNYTGTRNKSAGDAYSMEGVDLRDRYGTNAWMKATDKATATQLGFMYQDYANANRADSFTGGNRTSSTMKDLYGFQFMYNPTAISYSMGTDTTIDWLGQGVGSDADPSLPLFGSGTVQFSLYLNRIIDMGALQGVTPEATSTGYRRQLSAGEIKGILTRGTEYDLEFLYRVLNGTPYKSPTMMNDLPTADFGLLFGLPIWLRFHDNLRYKGVVTNLNVNHVMFTRDMIPMLTEVTVTFSRIPVITWDSKISSAVNNAMKNTQNQGSTS